MAYTVISGVFFPLRNREDLEEAIACKNEK